MKRCGNCKRILPWSAFHKNLCSEDGHQSWCRECVSAHNHRYYTEHREARLAYGANYRAAQRLRESTR